MRKALITFMFFSFLLQVAYAQKRDTLSIFMNSKDEAVKNKVDAEYLLLIMSSDSSSGTKVYPISEYYLNGSPKFSGSIDTKPLKPFIYEGTCISYFPDGKKQSIINYLHGYKFGNSILYYPNGMLYTVVNYAADSKCYLIECRDSLGNVLAKNGNGKWLKYNYNVKAEIEEGMVQDSLEEGEWHETYLGHEKFINSYHKGNIVFSTDPQQQIGEIVFTVVEQMPAFKGGYQALHNMLNKLIIYPKDAENQGIKGVVYVECIVEKDGTLSNIKIPNSGYANGTQNGSLQAEALRVVKLLPPWIPAKHIGLHVRVIIDIPVSFVINN